MIIHEFVGIVNRVDKLNSKVRIRLKDTNVYVWFPLKLFKEKPVKFGQTVKYSVIKTEDNTFIEEISVIEPQKTPKCLADKKEILGVLNQVRYK